MSQSRPSSVLLCNAIPLENKKKMQKCSPQWKGRRENYKSGNLRENKYS